MYIQSTKYIHNSIFKIFTKVPSWTLDTNMNATLFCRCCLTPKVTFRYLECYISDIFLAYSRLIQPYLVLLRQIKKPGVFRKLLVQSLSGIFSKLHIIFRQIQTYTQDYLGTLCFKYVPPYPQ